MYNLDLFDESPATEAAVDKARMVDDSAGNASLAAKPESEKKEDCVCERSSEAMRWVIEEIESIADAGNSKTRLKNIKASEDAYQCLLAACLLIAQRKRVAYERARTGGLAHAATSSIGWVQRDPELAAACYLLTRAAVAVTEIPMLPQAFMPH